MFVGAVENAYEDYKRLVGSGINPEDARYLLPNACKTEVVTTFNIRQWRHVFKHRGLNPRAQWEIRDITKEILKQFGEALPEFFGDLYEEMGRGKRI